MNDHNIKYSILIPARNGVDYLPTCIRTITGQLYNDYELIISDDHSTDGTKKYLAELNHPNIKITEPPESMSMSEHWDWVLSKAMGEWVMFVGQDDGLQGYFFQLADRLTEIALKNKIRAIMSERAYYWWPGCNHIYGNKAIEYKAYNKVKILNCLLESIKVLTGAQEYFELPQMYTTALFHRSLIEETRLKQNGKVIVTHPQDANLAAVACSLEKRYLKSFIPLGWVGTSPKSAGMAVSSTGVLGEKEVDNAGIAQLKIEYENKIKKSKLSYHKWAGEFSLCNMIIYYWQALLQTNRLRKPFSNALLRSYPFRTILVGIVLHDAIVNQVVVKKNLLSEINNVIKVNGLNYVLVVFFAIITGVIKFLLNNIFLAYRILRRFKRLFIDHRIRFNLLRNKNEIVNLSDNAKIISSKIENADWINNLNIR